MEIKNILGKENSDYIRYMCDDNLVDIKNSKIKADIPWSGTITWNSWSIYYSKDITWSWTII